MLLELLVSQVPSIRALPSKVLEIQAEFGRLSFSINDDAVEALPTPGLYVYENVPAGEVMPFMRLAVS
jgi:hypothetical protein